MNQKPQSYIGFFQLFVVLGALVFFTSQSLAGVVSIYKWKDEQGKVHFTDDPLKIPLKYRSDPGLEKTRGLPPSRKSSSQKPANKVSSDDTAGNTDEQDQKPEESEADKNKKKEVAALKEALSFLKSDIERYKKYETYVPQQRHAVLLRNDIVGVLPKKEALAKKLKTIDSPLAKQISGYLKGSLQKDYEAKKREYPRRTIFISERLRINGEKPMKSSLVKQLAAKLDTASDKTSSQSKTSISPEPPQPQEPVEDSNRDPLKNARQYGGY